MLRLHYQKGSWDCGPTGLKNTLVLLGRSVEWDSVVQWTQASESGTYGAALMRALKWLKVRSVEYSSTDQRRSWNRLTRLSRPAMICVDQDSHWVSVVAGVGRRENGLMIYGRAELLRRWTNNQNRMYGIFICEN
jgi:hypothetical protein